MEISCPHCTTRFKAELPDEPRWLRCGKCGGRFVWDGAAQPRKKTFAGRATHRRTGRLKPIALPDESAEAPPVIGKAFMDVVEGTLQQRALMFGGDRVSFGAGDLGRDTDMPIKDGNPSSGTFLLEDTKVAIDVGPGLHLHGKALPKGTQVNLGDKGVLVVGGERLGFSIVRKGNEVEGVVFKHETRAIWYLLVRSRLGFGTVEGRLSFEAKKITDVLGRIHFTEKGWYISRRGECTIKVGEKVVAKARGRPLLPGNEICVGDHIRLQFDILGPYDPFESFVGDL